MARRTTDRRSANRASVHLGLVLAALGALCGCAAAEAPRDQTAIAASAPANGEPRAQPGSIDELFRGFRHELPAPETLSEQNGPWIECGDRGATYTLLSATAAKVPIASDADLVRLVPWCRDEDVCVRQIALDAVVPYIGYDHNALVLPHMHDPEHFLYHDILLALRAHLDRREVDYDPQIFDGLFLAVEEGDFAELIHGRWEQEVDRKAVNFESSVEVDAEQIRVTEKETSGDPAWPDHTWTTKIKTVVLSDQRQYVITGAWNIESNANGYQGSKIEPSQFVYRFWLVAKDIVWFKDGEGAYWIKLHRR